MEEYILLIAFFGIATFYSSVGFGGGSSYLAILSLFITDFYEIRTMSLVLNLTVVLLGTLNFIRNKVFSFKDFWPFLALSIPMAFFGAQFRFKEKTFFIILGTALIAAAIFMVLQSITRFSSGKKLRVLPKFILGGSIGMLSGLAGIGGGIFLSPTLNLIGWQNSRKVAALASVFILVNSVAGLTGLYVSGTFSVNPDWGTKLLATVIAGGLLGSFLSNRKFNVTIIRWLTAVLVAYVGLKLLFLHVLELSI